MKNLKKIAICLHAAAMVGLTVLCSSCDKDNQEDVLNHQTGGELVSYFNMFDSADTPVDYSSDKTKGVINIPAEGGTYTFHLSDRAVSEHNGITESITSLNWNFSASYEVIYSSENLPENYLDFPSENIKPIFDQESVSLDGLSNKGFEYLTLVKGKSFSLTIPENTTGRERQFVFMMQYNDHQAVIFDAPFWLIVCQGK